MTHSLATMVERLREDSGSIGLVTGNGWFLTKHALGLYSNTPSAKGFLWSSQHCQVKGAGGRLVTSGHNGAAALETYTVEYNKSGSPVRAILSCLAADGSRAWAQVSQGPSRVVRGLWGSKITSSVTLLFVSWAEASAIDPLRYRLSSSAEGEAYVLERSQGGWAVFYSERGNRNDERWHPDEAHALDDLKERLERDGVANRGLREH